MVQSVINFICILFTRFYQNIEVFLLRSIAASPKWTNIYCLYLYKYDVIFHRNHYFCYIFWVFQLSCWKNIVREQLLAELENY